MRQFKYIALLIGLTLCVGCSSSIHDAARQGDVQQIRALVQSKPARLESRDRGVTPLHTAVLYHQVEATAVLLELGADADATFDDGRYTALSAARERRARCDGPWLADEIDKLNYSGMQSDTIYSRQMFLEDLYGPQAKPQWDQVIALLEKAQLSVIGPDGKRYRVITRLAPMPSSAPWAKPSPAITIAAGPKGPMYTARQGEKVIVRNATIDQLQASHPDLYNQVKNRFASDREYMAEHSSARDFTLSPQPVPSAADGPAMDRFYDASERK